MQSAAGGPRTPHWARRRLPAPGRPPRSIPPPAPCVSYSGTVSGVTVHVVWTGRDAEHGVDLVGTVPASLAAYLALQAWPETDLVISAGTAGGFRAKVRACAALRERPAAGGARAEGPRGPPYPALCSARAPARPRARRPSHSPRRPAPPSSSPPPPPHPHPHSHRRCLPLAAPP
jgi:hypothetical protein